MRERPILFSGPMVRAILAGQKTQTRRVVNMAKLLRADARDYGPDFTAHAWSAAANAHTRCPYGEPGDRLWVKETWCEPAPYPVWYRADFFQRYGAWESDAGGFVRRNEGPWRPSIYMPRWASRITLEVTSVRVERLKSLTKDDAIAEGAHAVDGPLGAYGDGPRWSMDRPHPVEVLGRDEGWKHCLGSPQMAFANLWINLADDPEAWDANPWVWVVSFKRAEAGCG